MYPLVGGQCWISSLYVLFRVRTLPADPVVNHPLITQTTLLIGKFSTAEYFRIAHPCLLFVVGLD